MSSSCCHCFSSLTYSLMFLNTISDHCRFRHQTLVTSASGRRHHRRRLLKHSPHNTPTPTIFKFSDDALQITLKPPNDSLQLLETRVNGFLEYGREALDDLRTIVSVDGETGRVVISCRRSTVEFSVALLFFCSLVVVVACKGLFKLKSEGEVIVYKRDRSLGGKVVAVGKRETDRWGSSRKSTPLSLGAKDYYQERGDGSSLRDGRRKRELPSWWPKAVNWSGDETVNKEEYQRLADQLIRAIMDHKMNGQDVSASDIVQLRHVCKTYGVRAITNTEHARDSLYRVSINFVLSYCESISNLSTSIQINGEDARDFVAGLADNIGLESGRAARMVSAAVAARTRSKILQAWALEVQNKHSEALVELFKVCVFHRVFPPEESSPEMEMVARGLEKSLDVEQRASILDSFITVCGKEVERSLVEALGLEQIHTAESVAQGE